MKPDPNMTLTGLKPNPRNPRKITDEKAAMLKRALEHFGDLGGIVYNQTTERLVGGHQRAKQLPSTATIEITQTYDPPTRTGTVAEGFVLVDGERFSYRAVAWDEDTEKAGNLAANRHGGEFDLPLLNEFLLELDAVNFDLDLTGFTAKELEDLLAPIEKVDPQEDEDTVYKPEGTTIVKLGDTFILGNHRLMCGDSTNMDHVTSLMAGELADMIFTDPPYNIAYEGGSKKREMIHNDEVDDFYQFLYDMYVCALAASKGGAAIYVTHADTERVNFTKAFMDAGFKLSSVIIWVKNNATFGRQDYFWKHEPMLYGWNSTGAHKWYGPTTEDTVWEIDRPSRSEEHPTMKPVQLITRALNNSSQERAVVLDLFGGSGSTMIACESEGRFARLMELDPRYVQVILNRWCGFTGKDAHLIATDGSLVAWSDLKAGASVPEGQGSADGEQKIAVSAEGEN